MFVVVLLRQAMGYKKIDILLQLQNAVLWQKI